MKQFGFSSVSRFETNNKEGKNKHKNNNNSGKAVANDGFVKISAEIKSGYGVIKKGLINKTKYFDFNLYLDIDKNIYKLKSFNAYVIGRYGDIPLKKITSGVNQVTIPLSNVDISNVKVKVEANYVIRRQGEKNICLQVAKRF